jgi:Delta3-Delta2-enoyl-CoA isomerase
MNNNETGITIDFGMKERKIAIIALKKEPANAMSLEFWEQLLSALEECEREEHGIRAVIFESTVLKDVFTAGNDINELYAPVTDRERYRKFWLVQTNFLTKLLVSKLVTIASIKGACPAGGTCLALCCDFRIQTKKGTFGLNEVMLGIPVPKFWARLFVQVSGKSESEKMLLKGELVEPLVALRFGLIDECCDCVESLRKRAIEIAEKMVKLPADGYEKTKVNLRGEFAKAWNEYGVEESESGFEMLSQPAIVEQLKRVLESLKRPSKL